MPDDVQPQDGGQGAEATTGIFDTYLSAVPEDARETVASYLKDAEKNVNGRLEQAAALEKQFGSFKDVDLSGYEPEDLSQLIAWHQQVTSSEDAFKAWLESAAAEAGLTQKQEDELDEAQATGELTREEIQNLIAQAADQRLNPVQEQLSSLEQEKAIDLEEKAIGLAFEEIQKEHKLDLSKDQREAVLRLGADFAYDEKGNDLPMGDASWVKKGFEDLQSITAGAQRAFVEEKAAAPAGGLATGGTPQAGPITDFKEAGDVLRERLREGRL